ncbi:hypothetical protein [Bradyrhizobium sp. WD16]|uniref:hypothetical protein n=1 Tax=Bradyrhizobium sp. WD16 TaxID=1521768 RepID=UPI0020A58F47|nr:hypothetical protein [Bradyrhizobium sp. WD16]UTD27520.1 hypothetical protein DB459_11880 [Bradyrhizobium sp. WD16]
MTGLFAEDPCTVVAPDGSLRVTRKALFAGRDLIVVAATPDAMILPGDEIRRELPNGTEEVFEVIDPVFYKTGLTGKGPHYQVKVRRKGAYAAHTGGNYTIHVSGSNPRVNIHSQDHSVNVAADSVFGDVASALKDGVGDPRKLEEILASVESMKRERGGAGYIKAYQHFVSVCADHIGLVTPFLPALTSMLGGG